MSSVSARPSIWGMARAIGHSPLAKLLAVPVWSRDPFGANFAPVEPAFLYRSRTMPAAARDLEAPVERLRVMTWNVKYGGGRIDFFYDGHGPRILMRQEEVLDHLEGLARAIRHVDPDVLFLQEVDRASSRSALIDQVRWLLDHTPLHYGAYASQWRASFIPAKSLGRVDTGVAILSKFPLRRATRLALPLIEEQDALTQYFFLRRCLLTATLELSPSQPALGLVCTHTSAFTSGQTKLAQLMRFKGALDAFRAEGLHALAGADLNVIPPGSTQLNGFADVAPTEDAFQACDFSGQLDWLEPLYQSYSPAISLEAYHADPAAHASHSSSGQVFWTRKLDYLFTSARWAPGSALTMQDAARGGVETMPLSDHAPLVATLELGRE